MSRIGIVTFRDFEDVELARPWLHFRDRGHEVAVLSPDAGERLEGRAGRTRVFVDGSVADAAASSFDALVVPGGEHPEAMRGCEEAIAFVRRFAASRRPLGAIEEGVELLRVAGVLEGVRVTSPPAFRHHLQNSGARWVDRDFVVDGPVVTVRDRARLEAFCAAFEALLTGETGARGADDPCDPTGCLGRLENALVTPIVPGEARAWVEEVQHGVEVCARRFCERTSVEHAEALRHIAVEDPALLPRVEALEHEVEALIATWLEAVEGARALGRAIQAAFPDEAEAHAAILAFCQQCIALLLQTRRQHASIRTWTLEAFDRDRGGGD